MGQARFEKPSNHPLREWRKKQNPTMTMNALAEKLGITSAHLSQIEHHKGRPSFDLATALAAITGMPVERFYVPKPGSAPANINLAAMAIDT